MIYELMYIVPPKYSDTEMDDVQKTVAELLAKHEAKVEKSEYLGKLKFAYPIKTFTHGNYVLAYIEAEGERITDIEQELKLAGEVLRSILVKRENGIPSVPYIIGAYQPPLTPEGKRARAVKTDAPAPKAPRAVAAEPVSSEAIEQKVDQILESDTISEDV